MKINVTGLTPINYQAVRWYEKYFHKILNQYTFEIRLMNDQLYYTFSDVDIDEWENTALREKATFEATEYLDNVRFVNINNSNVKFVKDVSNTVKTQYVEQMRIIFDSFAFVEQIMQYTDNPLVANAVRVVEESRANDESKRKYWRVLNEKYYGLDIHPLMEYELNELQNLVYFCEHPDEIPGGYHPVVFVATAIPAGTAVGLFAMKLFPLL